MSEALRDLTPEALTDLRDSLGRLLLCTTGARKCPPATLEALNQCLSQLEPLAPLDPWLDRLHLEGQRHRHQVLANPEWARDHRLLWKWLVDLQPLWVKLGVI